MESHLFLIQSTRWRDKLCDLYMQFVHQGTALLRVPLLADQMLMLTHEDQEKQWYLFLDKMKMQVLQLDHMVHHCLDSLKEKMNHVNQTWKTGTPASYRILSQQIQLHQVDTLIKQLPSDYPCKHQLSKIIRLVRQMLLLTRRYAKRYLLFASQTTYLTHQMNKVVCLYMNRSWISVLIGAVNHYTQQMIQQLPQSVQLDQKQKLLTKMKKDLFQQVSQELQVEIQNLQALQVDKMLTALQYQNKLIQADEQMHLFPIIGEMIHMLHTSLFSVAKKSNLELQQQTKSTTPPTNGHNNAGVKKPLLPYVELLLLQYGEDAKKKQEECSRQEQMLAQLSRDAEKLEQQLKRHRQVQKQEGKQLDALDVPLAKHWMILQRDFDRLTQQRNDIAKQMNQLRQNVKENQAQKKQRDQVQYYLQHWDQRQFIWKQLAEKELELLTNHKRLRFQCYTDLSKWCQEWQFLINGEIRTYELSLVTLIQRMFRELDCFIQREWNGIQEGHRKFLATMGPLGASFRETIQQVAALCPQQGALVLGLQQNVTKLLDDVELYLLVMTQTQQLMGLRQGISCLGGLMQLFCSEKNIQIWRQQRDQVSKLLQKRHQEVSSYLLHHNLLPDQKFKQDVLSNMQRMPIASGS